MLDNYRRILSHAPARRFSIAGLIGRFPISMVGLSLVLMIQHRTHSYGVATAVASTASLAGATLSPMVSKVADRLGQAKVLALSAASQSIALIGLVMSVTDHVRPTAYFFAALLGGSNASIGAFIRSRWSAYLEDGQLKQTAFAWESIVDELIFIAGPTLAPLLSTKVADIAPFIFVITFLNAGSLWLARQHSTEPRHTRAPVAHRSEHKRAPATTPGIAGVMLGFIFLGGTFISADLATVAIATEHNQRVYSGAMLGIWAFGSLIGGIIYGSRPSRREPAAAFVLSAIGLGLLLVPLPFLARYSPMPLVTISAMLWLSGFFVSPTLIGGFALVDRMSERHRVTESLSWSMSGIGIGIAFMGAIAGRVIDRYGVVAAWWMVAALSCGHAVVAAANMRAARRRLAAVAASAPAST